MDIARIENFVGALAIAVGDRIESVGRSHAGFGGEAPAAIVQIGTTPGLTIQALSSMLSLTHSATTRLIAKLAAEGIVIKSAGHDAREIRLGLTCKGEAIKTGILKARQGEISTLVRVLPEEAQQALGHLLERMLAAAPSDEAEAMRICRLCDEQACPQDHCPITTEASRTN